MRPAKREPYTEPRTGSCPRRRISIRKAEQSPKKMPAKMTLRRTLPLKTGT